MIAGLLNVCRDWFILLDKSEAFIDAFDTRDEALHPGNSSAEETVKAKHLESENDPQ